MDLILSIIVVSVIAWLLLKSMLIPGQPNKPEQKEAETRQRRRAIDLLGQDLPIEEVVRRTELSSRVVDGLQVQRRCAINFLKQNLSIEAVARGTELSIEEVRQIQRQISDAT